MSDEGSSPLIAMVALNSPSLPETIRFLTTLRKRVPAAPAEEEVQVEDGTMSFQLDDELAFCSLMPGPIPWSDLEGPCATAWWWPEATEKMKGHNSHILVVLMRGEGDPVSRNILLTHLVAAVASATNSAGVYWGNGTVVHEPKAFCQRSAELAPDNLTPDLWIDMRLERNDDGSLRFFTTGMSAFDKLEIEIDSTRSKPQEILDFCYGVIDYILSGAEIMPGETIGRSAEERVRVLKAPSMWDRGKAMKLALR